MANFFIRFQDQIKGPFSGPDLQVFAEKGQLKPAMQVSSDGKKWVEARTIDSLWPEIEIDEEEPSEAEAVPDETVQIETSGTAETGVLPSTEKTESFSDIATPQNELLAELGLGGQETQDDPDATGKMEMNVGKPKKKSGSASLAVKLASLEEQIEILRHELAEANRIIQSHSLVLSFINKQNNAAAAPPPSSVAAPPPRKSTRVSRRRRRI